MEALISHLVTTTTTIREEQIRQGSAIAQLREGQKDMLEVIRSSGKASSVGGPKWLQLMKPALSASMKHALGILTISYVLRGGDLMTLMSSTGPTLIELLKLL